MDLTKKKLMAVLSVMFAATLMMSSTSQAADSAPGEGYYAGAFLGFGTGIVQGKVTSFTTAVGGSNTGTFETDRGGFGLSGIQGGGWAGWGMKTADDLYFGAEISALGSDERFELSSSTGLEVDGEQITSVTAKRNWSTGGAVRVGYYVNNDTLLSVTGGVAVSQFDVEYGKNSETYYAGGPQVGAQIETNLSKIDPNLSLRMEFVYTNYLTADVLGIDGSGNSTTGHDSEITGHDSAGRIGVTYRF
jgi:hypothetical protein